MSALSVRGMLARLDAIRLFGGSRSGARRAAVVSVNDLPDYLKRDIGLLVGRPAGRRDPLRD